MNKQIIFPIYINKISKKEQQFHMSNNAGLKPIEIYMQKNNSNFIQSNNRQIQSQSQVYANTQPKKSNNILEQKQRQRQIQRTHAPVRSTFNQPQNNRRIQQYNRSKQRERERQKLKQGSNKDKIKNYKQQQSHELGNQFLYKIQNMLTEVVKPKKSARKKVQSNIQQDYQKSQRIMKLYAKHQQKINNLSQVQAKKAYDQFSQLKDFKVSNKMSIYYNNKDNKHQKPLYQRSQQIVQAKQKKLLQIRIKKTNQQMKASLEQEQQAIKIREARSKKVAWQELQKKMQEMKAKQKERQNNINAERINIVKQISKQYRQKPEISPISKKIFEKIMNQKGFDKNFVKRNQQYQHNKKISKEELLSKYEAQYTPFRPHISQTSRQLVKNRKTTSFLQQRQTTPTQSCKCLKKDVNLNGNSSNQRIGFQHSHNRSVDNLTKNYTNLGRSPIKPTNKKQV